MDVWRAGGVRVEEFGVEGVEVGVWREDGGEVCADDFGNLGGKGGVGVDCVAETDELLVCGGIGRIEGTRSQEAAKGEEVFS